MAYLDHDIGPDGASRATGRPVQRTPAQSPVLDLQRLAGNAAVSQVMKSRRSDSTVPVQRIDDEDASESMEEEEEEVQEEEEAEEEPEAG